MPSNIVTGSELNITVTSGAATATGLALGAGSNRALLALCHHEQTHVGDVIPSLSVGGVSFTKIHNRANGSGSTFSHSEVWAVNEAGAAGIGANPAVAVGTPAAGVANIAITFVTAADCEQDLSKWTKFADDGDTCAVAMSAALSDFTTGSAIVGAAGDTLGGNSINTALGDTVTEFTGSDRNAPVTSTRAVAFYGTAASAAPSVGVDSNSTSTGGYQSMVLVGIPDYVSVNALAGSAAATAAGTGAIVTPGLSLTLRDIDTNALKNAVSYANVHVVNAASRGTIAASLTSKTTSAGGVLTLRAPGIATIGATYDVVGWNSDGTDRFHASAVCADL